MADDGKQRSVGADQRGALKGEQRAVGSAEDQAVRGLLDPELMTALRGLPDRHRTVIYLADMQGLGYKQISALTGIPLGSVKLCLHRARYKRPAAPGGYAPDY